MTSVLTRRESIKKETNKAVPYDDTGRDQSDTATSQGKNTMSRSQEEKRQDYTQSLRGNMALMTP